MKNVLECYGDEETSRVCFVVHFRRKSVRFSGVCVCV